jgi:hypothetical protein
MVITVDAEPVTLAELQAAVAVGRLVARIDADSVPLSQAAKFWKSCESISRFAQSGAMLLARRVDE